MAKKKSVAKDDGLTIDVLKKGLEAKRANQLHQHIAKQDDVKIEELKAPNKGLYKVSSKKIGRDFLVAFKSKKHTDFSVFN